MGIAVEPYGSVRDGRGPGAGLHAIGGSVTAEDHITHANRRAASRLVAFGLHTMDHAGLGCW